MAAKTDSGEEPMTKKVKVDFLQMIDDDVLTKMLSFGGLKAMVQFQQVSNRGRGLLHDDNPLLVEVMKYLCHPNKDDSVGFELHELWEKQEPHVPVTLEYLVFYKACRDKHIFDVKAFRAKAEQDLHAAPQAALRVQALFRIMEKFPRAKASWESS